MSVKQQEYAQSLATQLLAVWSKLGGSSHEKAAEYAGKSEADIHGLLFTARKTKSLRRSFGPDPECDYTAGELRVCIAHLIRVLQGYKDMWFKQWTSEKDARERCAAEDAALQEDGFTFERAQDWITANGHSYKVQERFVFVKRIGAVDYYRPRAQAVTLYTYAEATRLLETYFPGKDLDYAFVLADDVGTAMLYKAKFEWRAQR